jgi:hypothetical protein
MKFSSWTNLRRYCIEHDLSWYFYTPEHTHPEARFVIESGEGVRHDVGTSKRGVVCVPNSFADLAFWVTERLGIPVDAALVEFRTQSAQWERWRVEFALRGGK